MTKAFASQGDMTEMNILFEEVGDGLWALPQNGIAILA